jgi:hypothetical protein
LKKKIKVGLIVDQGSQSYLNYDLYKRGLTASNYSIVCLIIQDLSLESNGGKLKIFALKILNILRERGIGYLIGRFLFSILEKIETKLIGANGKYSNILFKYPISMFDLKCIRVRPKISSSGFVYRYEKADILKIKEMKLDVLVRGGSGILRGEILDVCANGILSFHHADNAVNRGGPSGFWEVYNKEPSTGFIIQKLSEELDGGEVLFKAAIPTASLYKLNQCKIYAKSSIFMHKLLEELCENKRKNIFHSKVPYSYPLYTVPGVFDIVKYMYEAYTNLLLERLRLKLGVEYRWGVAYQLIDDWSAAVLWKSKIIDNPPFRFFADPFAVYKNNRKIIYVEDFDYRVGKGTIAALEINDQGESILGTALEEDFHLSYPFLFENGDDLYMIPETHQSNDIRIYKCFDFPLGWKLHKILIDNVSAADTIMFHHNGKFWIMTNLDSAEINDHCSELHIYSADSFDSDVWCPHPLNPVIFNSTCARNGGVVYSDDKIYRVYQKQGFKTYGKSVGVAEIVDIGLDNYEEKPLFDMPAEFFKNIIGTHTFTFRSGILCIDFSRYQKIR